HTKQSHMAAFATAEACDSNAELISNGDLRALHPVFKIYGQRRCFSGPIVTLKVFEDNVLNNGWVGIVVNGCVRDVDEINDCDVGVKALGSNPLKSSKKGHGEKNVPVNIGGTLIRDGEWLYADSDGILISKTELSV
ncbi:hypothetical protein F2Q70_00007938, partial [Brassica cretica]